MAKEYRLNLKYLRCSICLDLMVEPVTLPCGHSFCKGCVNRFWVGKFTSLCPECNTTFRRRPVVETNTILQTVTEELRKAEDLTAISGPLIPLGPGDVPCDVCIGVKKKALKSCLVCCASFCDGHLQTHLTSPALMRHKLTEPSKKLNQYICSRHNEVKELFCRDHHKCICCLCAIEEHKGHDIVKAALERAKRQRDIEVCRRRFQQRIRERERDLKMVAQLKAINASAATQRKTKKLQIKDIQKKLRGEIDELRRRDSELEKLSLSDNDIEVIQDYPSLSRLCKSPNINPGSCYQELKGALSRLNQKNHLTSSQNHALLSEYSCYVLLQRL